MKDILNSLPERPSKPREEGLTMMMDKGLNIQEAENNDAVLSSIISNLL